MNNRLIKLFLDVEVRDKFGKLKYKEFKKADTFLTNFGNFLYKGLFQGGGVNPAVASMKRLDSTIDAITAGSSVPLYCFETAEADDTRGLVVGSSVTAVTYADYAMGALIPHATDGLKYYATTQNIEVIEGQFYVARLFENMAVADLDIKEMGLVVKQTYSYLIARDIITTATLATNDILNAKYIIDVLP